MWIIVTSGFVTRTLASLQHSSNATWSGVISKSVRFMETWAMSCSSRYQPRAFTFFSRPGWCVGGGVCGGRGVWGEGCVWEGRKGSEQ